MLNSIIRFALHYRVIIVTASVVVLVYGSYTTATLPIDVFPDLDRPRVVVMTEVPGQAAEKVETLVTTPLERELLGATGVHGVRSQSGPGLSVVTVEFGWDEQIHVARQVVQEKLSVVRPLLPPNIHPQMAPIGSILGQIMLVGIHRRAGPNGGVLASVGNTHFLAELVWGPKRGQVSCHLWNPRDAQNQRQEDAAKWTKLEADAEALTLLVAGKQPMKVPLIPLDAVGNKTAAFQGTSDELAAQPEAPEQTELTVTFNIGGKPHKTVFGSLQNRMMDLRTSVDWVIRPRILKIRGIAQVFVMGEGRKQYQVLVDPEKLTQHAVSLEQVETALRKSNIDGSGGYAERHLEEQAIRFEGRLGPEATDVLEQIKLTPVKMLEDRVITIANVAEVTTGPALKRGDAAVNGSPGILLTVARQPHFDTRAVTDEVLAALKELQAALPADIDINPDFFQMKRFIDRGVFNVAEALALGAALVLVVLFLFLLNVRTTFISLTAIPLSLAMTALSFKGISWLGGTPLSINVMTLGGIAVAMGELVDDAIVDVENIFRRLRLNSGLPMPRPALEVIYQASVEIRSAIVFGTLMVILVFLPLFALSGLEGRLFSPLGTAYIVSILASLLVSLTVTPVLAYYLLPRAKAVHRLTDSPLLRGLKWLAGHMVRVSMAQAGLLLLAGWVLFGISALVLSKLGSELLPDFDEGTVQMTCELPPGATLKASNQAAAQIEERLQAMQKDGLILGFLRRTGRSELEEHADPVNLNEFFVAVNPAFGWPREKVKSWIQKDIEETAPAFTVEAEQPLKHLINEMVSGVKADVAIRIYGDDLGLLYAAAQEVQKSLAGIKGLLPPVIESQREVTEIRIFPRADQLALYNVDRKHLADWIETALKGQVVSEVLLGQKRFDLVVRFEDMARTQYQSLGKLRVDLPDGKGWVPLEELAVIDEYGQGANVINHDNGRRRIVVRCMPSDRDVGSVLADIQQNIRNKVTLPPGYFIEYGGQFESQQQATRLITILSAIAVVGMFVVLYVLYPSARIVLQILNALPMAFIGGVAALVITQQPVTVAALVGFISVGGISARNGILLVSHYLHLMKHEGEGFTQEMIMRGSLERLAPVLMTALTAGISLLPLVLGGHQPGREILYPVATVILGGLVTSTLCEFLLHPGLFWKFSGKTVSKVEWAAEHA